MVVNGKPHPLYKVWQQYSKQALEWLRDFGMTPRSRLASAPDHVDDDDPMDKLLNTKVKWKSPPE